MKVYVVIDRGFATETRGVSGTQDEITETVESFKRTGTVLRILNEAGQEIVWPPVQ